MTELIFEDTKPKDDFLGAKEYISENDKNEMQSALEHYLATHETEDPQAQNQKARALCSLFGIDFE